MGNHYVDIVEEEDSIDLKAVMAEIKEQETQCVEIDNDLVSQKSKGILLALAWWKIALLRRILKYFRKNRDLWIRFIFKVYGRQ